MVKTLGMLFGIVFLAIGVLGFVPGVTTTGPDGMPMLLGIFMVNTVHSIVHIASGAVFLIASMSGAGAARLWFQLFGIIYAVVAVLGDRVLRVIPVPQPLKRAHVLAAIVGLYCKFTARD